MPELTVRAIRAERTALVVGNGPSCRAVPWPRVWRWLAARDDSWPALWLINAKAMGPTNPRYAVAVDHEPLEEFGRHRFGNRTEVVTNYFEDCTTTLVDGHPIRALFATGKVLVAPHRWPGLASGPLSVWAATALGFGRVYLYGLDGTARPEAMPEEIARRAGHWESQILRHRLARDDGLGPELVRVWPSGALPEREPLAAALAATLVAP